MDDIFCLFNNEREAALFLEYMNKQHGNIKFTCEPEKNGKLPFLDILIEKKQGGGFYTSVYHKSTYTGLLTNFLSFSPSSYKLALVKTLIHRIYKICNTWLFFDKNIKDMTKVLKRNQFPDKTINKEIRKYLNNIFQKTQEEGKTKENGNFFKLPYIGITSKETQNRIDFLCKKLCKGTKIKLIFTVCKIKSFLPTKSKAPSNLLSGVVYRYICPICGDSYIGETMRHWETRRHEHLHRDKTSHIYKHTHNNDQCKGKSNENNFKIIDKSQTQFSLKLKQAMQINKHNPTLINKQKKHVILTLDIQ